MASGIGKATEVEILNHILGKATAAKPLNFYVALCTAEPTGGEAATLTEAAYTGYARKKTEPSEWESAVEGSPSSIRNSSSVTFAACTAGSAKVRWVALVTTASGAGRTIAWGELEKEVQVDKERTPFTFNPKTLVLTLA